jgi:hypothetical protein
MLTTSTRRKWRDWQKSERGASPIRTGLAALTDPGGSALHKKATHKSVCGKPIPSMTCVCTTGKCHSAYPNSHSLFLCSALPALWGACPVPGSNGRLPVPNEAAMKLQMRLECSVFTLLHWQRLAISQGSVACPVGNEQRFCGGSTLYEKATDKSAIKPVADWHCWCRDWLL